MFLIYTKIVYSFIKKNIIYDFIVILIFIFYRKLFIYNYKSIFLFLIRLELNLTNII